MLDEDEPVGRKDEGVDDVSCFERVKVFALVQIPEHGDYDETSR